MIASLAFQAVWAALEFWVIGQFARHPMRFTVGMVVLNTGFGIFNMIVGLYIIGGVCFVMAARHAKNARRLARANYSGLSPTMITPIQATVLMTLFPDYRPGELLKGAMTLAGLMGPGDVLTEAGKGAAAALILKAAGSQGPSLER